MKKMTLKCILTKNVPVVPTDLLRKRMKKNGSADIDAFINGTWQKIGFVHEWPEKSANVSITFKLPNPYVILLDLKDK